jgi:hypothetical protein
MKKFLAIIALLFLTAPAFAGITVTTGAATLSSEGYRGLMCYSIAWTSDASGNVNATLADIGGTIERVVYAPDVTSAPTTLYDVTLTDRDGLDVLNSTGANLSSTTVSQKTVTCTDATTARPMATMGSLALSVSAAGNDKKGIIRIYLRQ